MRTLSPVARLLLLLVTTIGLLAVLLSAVILPRSAQAPPMPLPTPPLLPFKVNLSGADQVPPPSNQR